MPVKVVDASALAALLFSEPAADEVAGRLTDAELAAPGLLSYELGNICSKKCRRHPDQARELRQAYQLLPAMGLRLYQVDGEAVLDAALQHDLTVYDASYLWLARQLTAPLVTLDQRLARLAG